MQDHFTERIITIYCLCDDFLRAWGHTDAPQAKLTTAQVMTVALVASALFSGNQERSRCFLKQPVSERTRLYPAHALQKRPQPPPA